MDYVNGGEAAVHEYPPWVEPVVGLSIAVTEFFSTASLHVWAVKRTKGGGLVGLPLMRGGRGARSSPTLARGRANCGSVAARARCGESDALCQD